MNKRLLAFFMVLVLASGLVACSSSSDELPSIVPTQEPAATQAPTIEPTEAPVATPEATPSEEPVATPETTPATEPQAGTDEKSAQVLSAYARYLEEFSKNPGPDFSPEYNEIRFSLGFVDEDDIPELFVITGDYHASGVRMVVYNDGSPVEVGIFGEFGVFYYASKKNLFISNYMGMGVLTEDFYRLSGNKAELLKQFYSSDDSGEMKIDGNPVDASEYDRQYNDMGFEADGEVSYYSALPYLLTTPNTEEYLKGKYNALKTGETFTTYLCDEVLSMVGSWDLTEANYKGPDGKYAVYPAGEYATGNFTVNSDGVTSLWFSKGVNSSDELITNYSFPVYYKPYALYEGFDNKDWSVQIASESYDRSIFATLVAPDKIQMMIVIESETDGEEPEYVFLTFGPGENYDEGP